MRVDPVYIGTPRPLLKAGHHLSADLGLIQLFRHGTRLPTLFQIPKLSCLKHFPSAPAVH